MFRILGLNVIFITEISGQKSNLEVLFNNPMETPTVSFKCCTLVL